MARIFLVCLAVVWGILSAAEIKGRVTSEDFPDGCPGADVLLFQNGQPTTFGTATDINGRYDLKDVPRGNMNSTLSFWAMRPRSGGLNFPAGTLSWWWM